MIDVQFVDKETFSVKIDDNKGIEYKLHLTDLSNEIDTEKCQWRFSAGKRITVTLKKKEEEKWWRLTKYIHLLNR